MHRPHLNSRPAAIYCDFDGTATQGDVLDIVLEKLADPGWHIAETQWCRGEIGSRECLARQIPMIRGGWSAIAEVLEDVKLEPTFPRFAAWCRKQGMALHIVSDGVDRIIHTLLAREGVTADRIWSNRLVESPGGELSLAFPLPPLRRSCGCGLCKCRVLDQADAGSLRVVIGDGRSDWCWASRADFVFAKSELLSYCFLNRIACRPFGNFDEISGALEALISREFDGLARIRKAGVASCLRAPA